MKKKKKRKKPYPNTVYEYDLMRASEEDWVKYDVILTKFSEDFDQKTQEENNTERLERFYNVIEKTVSLVFDKKEAFKNEEDKMEKKGNMILRNIRILMRKKTSMSRKIMMSNSANKTLKLMKALEIV